MTGGGSDEPRSDAAVDSAAQGEVSIFPVEDAFADYGVEDVFVPEPEVGAKTIDLTIDGIECKTITCPASFPFVVGCSISMNGSSSQACIVHQSGGSSVIFKEGQGCGSVYVKGTVTCSSEPGPPLDATTCRVNKGKPLYITSLSMCPG